MNFIFKIVIFTFFFPTALLLAIDNPSSCLFEADNGESVWYFQQGPEKSLVKTNTLNASCLDITSTKNISDYASWDIPNQHFLSLTRNQGESIGDVRSYTTLESFSFPCNYQNIWPFLDMKVHCFDDVDDYAANIGFGIRLESKYTQQIFGINAYYDYRKYHHNHYNQLGLGFEILGECWNFRLNGYLPIGKTKFLTDCCFFDEYIGDYFFLKESFISSLKGINFEIESLVAKMCWGEIYLAIGSYYYNGKGCHKNIYGSEYRASMDFCRYFNFSLTATYDNVFKTRVLGLLCIIIPFIFECEGARYCPYEANPAIFQSVQREEMIVLKEHNRWTWNF